MPGSNLNNGNTGGAGVPSQPQGRSKHPRPNSPVAGPSIPSTQPNPDTRPPPKRARKAINCEPCRNSKLKCDRKSQHVSGEQSGHPDLIFCTGGNIHANSSPRGPRTHRNRPCSSCILRGTTASCYQGQEADPNSRDDSQQTRIDPGVEFNRIRLSLSLLESHIFQNAGSRTVPVPQISAVQVPRPLTSLVPYPHIEPAKDLAEMESSNRNKPLHSTAPPGMLGQQGHGGFYAGPTSALSHLMTTDKEEPDSGEGAQASLFHRSYSDAGMSVPSSGTATPTTVATQMAYDEDLFVMLPPKHTIDGLIEYYFEYCNWIYRHVNQPAFLAGWLRYKSGEGGDRIILGTVCIILALSVRYLPPSHPLASSLTGTIEEVGTHYYGIMLSALDRYRESMRKEGSGKGYTLDLLELLLLRSHYLTFAKEDPEEIWSVRGELISIGTALGLHRDPGGKFEKFVAERRRWVWWHILLLERWQAFMFGRPPAINARHFNTRMPSYCDPSIDKSGRLYKPNIALFELAYVLGDIMEDAVSFRPVPYSAIQAHDRRLLQWMEESLPSELELDDFRIARYLASPENAIRRLGVQSVIIRSAYHHIRFTLHRPYAHIPNSLEIAVASASQIITLVGQTRSDFLSNTALAVPGHMNWGPFHVFSAAMFFSFQLISHPDQPAGKLFRENVRKAMTCLEQSRWMPIADKALTILEALAPLHSDEFLQEKPEKRAIKKAQVLKLVKTLAFPYQDAPYSRSGETPDSRASDSPLVPHFDHSPGQHSRVSPPFPQMPWLSDATDFGPPINDLLPPVQRPPPPPPPPALVHAGTHNIPQPYANGDPSFLTNNHTHSLSVAMTDIFGPPMATPYDQTQPPADEGSMWGAAIGFPMGEWHTFLNVMQPPDNTRSKDEMNQ